MKAEDETPERQALRLRLQDDCATIGRMLADVMPAGVCFALAMFDVGEEGSMAYVSNARREDFIALLDEWREKMRSQ